MLFSGSESLTLAITRIILKWTRGFNPLQFKGLKAPCLKNTDSHIFRKGTFLLREANFKMATLY